MLPASQVHVRRQLSGSGPQNYLLGADKLVFAFKIVADNIKPRSMDNVVNNDIAPIKIISNNSLEQLTVF